MGLLRCKLFAQKLDQVTTIPAAPRHEANDRRSRNGQKLSEGRNRLLTRTARKRLISNDRKERSIALLKLRIIPEIDNTGLVVRVPGFRSRDGIEGSSARLSRKYQCKSSLAFPVQPTLSRSRLVTRRGQPCDSSVKLSRSLLEWIDQGNVPWREEDLKFAPLPIFLFEALR